MLYPCNFLTAAMQQGNDNLKLYALIFIGAIAATAVCAAVIRVCSVCKKDAPAQDAAG